MVLYEVLLVIIIILFIWFKLTKSQRKGSVGENIVSRRLTKLPHDKYYILNDLLLPSNYGTTQIDHVVVSVYGVFVIETKNYSGIITGGEESEQWTKNMYGYKYTMPNPVRQNKAHAMAIKSIMKQKGVFCNIRSIIAFSGQATIRARSDSSELVYFNQVVPAIKSYNDEQLTLSQVDTIVKALQENNITDKKIRRQHSRNVKAHIAKNKYLSKHGVCPRCGGKLVVRKGNNGAFYGCSNYPNCRYTKDI